jgi:hypothetical protein
LALVFPLKSGTQRIIDSSHANRVLELTADFSGVEAGFDEKQSARKRAAASRAPDLNRFLPQSARAVDAIPIATAYDLMANSL